MNAGLKMIQNKINSKCLIFATENPGKVQEVRDLFDGYQILCLKDLEDVPEIIEDGETFEENSLKKAMVIYEKFHSAVIADDSGLEVESLGRRPGVYSARYAGETATHDDNNEKLLAELDSEDDRRASFVCCAVFYDGKHRITSEGRIEGRIIREKRGSEGFGYDPLFVPNGYEKTFSELGLEEKNCISHRALAFKNLKRKLTESGLFQS